MSEIAEEFVDHGYACPQPGLAPPKDSERLSLFGGLAGSVLAAGCAGLAMSGTLVPEFALPMLFASLGAALVGGAIIGGAIGALAGSLLDPDDDVRRLVSPCPEPEGDRSQEPCSPALY